jgi:hypothetical protein
VYLHNSSKQQQKKLQQRAERSMSLSLASVPSDLLYVIIEYETKTFKGLYKLRQINKEWKKLAESSLLWMQCSLVFYCPEELLHPYVKNTVFHNLIMPLNEVYDHLKRGEYDLLLV